MKLRFLGKDPSSNPDDCPSLFATDQDSYIIQGWIVEDHETLAGLALGEDDAVVEIPAAMMIHLANDGLPGEVRKIQSPIVRVTVNGSNYIVRGAQVHDTEALCQMMIPSHETCVEVPKAAIRALTDGA